MKKRASITLLVAFALSCAGGGAGSDSGRFLVLSANIAQGQSIPINSRIELSFNRPVELSSVDFGSLSIVPNAVSAPGAPNASAVQGSFFLKPGSEDHVLVFQPSCPTDPENLTGGFVPGNQFGPVSYTLIAKGLRSQDGEELSNPFSLFFSTNSAPAPVLLDPVPGAPSLVNANSLPDSLGLNLFSDPITPLSLVLDQPVQASSVNNQSIRVEFTDADTDQTVVVPCEITLSANCTSENQAILSVVPVGVLPAAQSLRFFLSKELQGFGGSLDKHPIDILFHTATVASAASPQPDAMLEDFDSPDAFEQNPDTLLALAEWEDGRLQAAPIFPSGSSYLPVDIEIGPLTTNGKVLYFSTEGGYLKDTAGSVHFFTNGIIEVNKFTLKAGLSPTDKTIFLGYGENPLIIRCRETFSIENNAELTVSGQEAPIVNGICTATGFIPPGEGRCGGGDGGVGSPKGDASSYLGGDGNGPFQIPGMGGKAGHSGFGLYSYCGASDDGNYYVTRPGGGGGGNWGIKETIFSPFLQYVTYCYSNGNPPCHLPDCTLPLSGCAPSSQVSCGGLVAPTNSNGERGADGMSTAKDSFTGVAPAKGGAAGDPIFSDTSDLNNFFGRKPFSFGVLEGELGTLLGGSGGGGGGDNCGDTVFPTPNFVTTDLSGGAGGGGGGVLWVQSLGQLTVLGKIKADGGDGGRGEIPWQPSGSAITEAGAGGGGGGAGGMILLESPTRVKIGFNALITARGGNRSQGGGLMQGGGTPGCPVCGLGVSNCTAAHGGAGGKGVIQIHVPFSQTLVENCDDGYTEELDPIIEPGKLQVEFNANGNVANTMCDFEYTLWQRFDPDPVILLPTFGPQSGAMSKWIYSGWPEYSNSMSYNLQGIDPVTGLINSNFLQSLASGVGGAVSTVQNSITVQSSSLAEWIAANPKLLIGDGFQPSANAALLGIENVSVSGNELVFFFSVNAELPSTVDNWTLYRRHFSTTVDGVDSSYPANASAKILFEGTDETSPGSMTANLATRIGPTGDLSLLSGKKLVRYRVLFDMASQGETLKVSLPKPGLDFIKTVLEF